MTDADDPFTYSFTSADVDEMFRRADRLKRGLPADEAEPEDDNE